MQNLDRTTVLLLLIKYKTILLHISNLTSVRPIKMKNFDVEIILYVKSCLMHYILNISCTSWDSEMQKLDRLTVLLCWSSIRHSYCMFLNLMYLHPSDVSKLKDLSRNCSKYYKLCNKLYFEHFLHLIGLWNAKLGQNYRITLLIKY